MHLMCCPNYSQQQFQILINPVNAFCMQVPRKKRLDYSTVLVCSHSNGTTLCLLCIHYNRYQILILSHVPRPKKCSFLFYTFYTNFTSTSKCCAVLVILRTRSRLSWFTFYGCCCLYLQHLHCMTMVLQDNSHILTVTCHTLKNFTKCLCM